MLRDRGVDSYPKPRSLYHSDIMNSAMFNLSVQVGHLFLIGFEGSVYDRPLEDLLREVRPGGVIFFQRNITGAAEFAELVRRTAAFLSTPPSAPPFLAIDLEGGKVDRLRDVLGPLPSARDAARAGLARELGRVAGRELASFSLHADFAPVLDLGSPESESVLGNRTAGKSPDEVVRFGGEFLEGLSESNILGCGKHFPGLGSGRLDSHLEMPRIEKEESLLWEQDLFPYRALASRLPMIMVAHAAYPSLERAFASSTGHPMPLVPASLSPAIVSGLLKGRMGYEGLVLSDDLEMGGALGGRSIGEAAVGALRAGCDLMLVCRHADNVRATFEAVLREAERDSDFRVLVEKAAQKALRARQRLRAAKTQAAAFSDWEGLRREIIELSLEIERRLPPSAEKGSGD